MREYLKFYIDGQWVQPNSPSQLEVINPATEKVAGIISMGNETDVDLAVKAARKAFHTYSLASVEARLELLNSIAKTYKQRWNEIADAITEEMGAPKSLSISGQAGSGYGLFKTAMANLQEYKFSHQQDTMTIIKEPIGVCGFITPWNWPINQIAGKIAAA
jgi:aldehyde dehydrogenase (NAD+)